LLVSNPGHFTPGERTPDTYWLKACMDPTAGQDVEASRKNPSPCRESNSGRPARSLVIILTEEESQ